MVSQKASSSDCRQKEQLKQNKKKEKKNNNNTIQIKEFTNCTKKRGQSERAIMYGNKMVNRQRPLKK